MKMKSGECPLRLKKLLEDLTESLWNNKTMESLFESKSLRFVIKVLFKILFF
jgi:hypothetical protein